MPSNLPPELLALLQSQQVGNTGSYMGDQFGSSHYAPIYGPGSMSGGGAEGGDWQQGPLTGYYGTQNGEGKKWSDQYNGANRNEYDAQGNYVKTDQWSGLTGGQEMLPLMMMLGPIAMQAMGAGFGAGAGSSAAGTAGAVAGDAFLPGMLGAGGSEVAMGSLIPGLEAYALPAAAAGGGAAGALAGDAYMPGQLAATGGESVAWGSTIPGLESYALPLGAGGAAGGAAAGAGGGGGAFQPPNAWATGAATGGGGLASMLGGAKGLIGAGAALAGGLAGAQGTPGTETTRKQELPDYLKGPVEKMLGYGTSLLDKQMAPGALAGYDLMQQKGLGLLNTPQLGNGFSRFFPGR